MKALQKIHELRNTASRENLPLLYQHLTRAYLGHCTLEDAVTDCAFELSRQNKELTEKLIKLAQYKTDQVILVKAGAGQ